jgi:hypothetical protein
MTTSNRRGSARGVGLCVVLVTPALLVSLASAQQFAELEFVNEAQSRVKGSQAGFCTADGYTMWDKQFANLVDSVLVRRGPAQNGQPGPILEHRYTDVVFDVNQCFGGGILDNLRDKGWTNPASFTSAARYDQFSYARSEDPASGIDEFLSANRPVGERYKRTESTYSTQWSQRILTSSARGAALGARAADTWGPAGRNRTSPQYTSNGAAGDNIRLAEGFPDTQRPKVILWGGSSSRDTGDVLREDGSYGVVKMAANWWSLSRMRDTLIARGLTDEDIFVMAPRGQSRAANPQTTIYENGPVMPNWVDAGTRLEDMNYAWKTWLNQKLDGGADQVLFWSSFGHGTTLKDAVKQAAIRGVPIVRAQPAAYQVDSDFASNLVQVRDLYQQIEAPEAEAGMAMPYFVVNSLISVPSLSVSLNSSPLSLISQTVITDPDFDGQYEYRFALTPQMYDQLLQSEDQLVTFNYDALLGDVPGFITQAGLTAGDFANGIIPAPGAVVVLALGACVAGQRRRRS